MTEGRKTTPLRVRVTDPSNAVWCRDCLDWIMRGAACPHYEVETPPARQTLERPAEPEQHAQPEGQAEQDDDDAEEQEEVV